MRVWLIVGLAVITTGCTSSPRPGLTSRGQGDHIVVRGQRFNIATPVVLWTDPGGCNAYQGEPYFGERSDRFNHEVARFSEAQRAKIAAGQITLPQLQTIVDQFVIHYDAVGTSQQCFNVLQKRGLSVNFLLDVDGTIYQTLDLKHRAWHASIANTRSIGIEIAHVGAVRSLDGGRGKIHRTPYDQTDFTPEQYAALGKLTAALSRIFPRIILDAPRDATGKIVTHALTASQFTKHHGLIGHYHIDPRKIDPGPAFDWDRVINSAQRDSFDQSLD